MKLNRKTLRRMILNEIRILTEDLEPDAPNKMEGGGLIDGEAPATYKGYQELGKISGEQDIKIVRAGGAGTTIALASTAPFSVDGEAAIKKDYISEFPEEKGYIHKTSFEKNEKLYKAITVSFKSSKSNQLIYIRTLR